VLGPRAEFGWTPSDGTPMTTALNRRMRSKRKETEATPRRMVRGTCDVRASPDAARTLSPTRLTPRDGKPVTLLTCPVRMKVCSSPPGPTQRLRSAPPRRAGSAEQGARRGSAGTRRRSNSFVGNAGLRPADAFPRTWPARSRRSKGGTLYLNYPEPRDGRAAQGGFGFALRGNKPRALIREGPPTIRPGRGLTEGRIPPACSRC